MERRDSTEVWFRLLCAVPVVTLACVYFEALLASWSLGHWPVPSLNDPKDLVTAPLHIVSTILVLGTYPSLLVTGVVAIRSWRTLLRPSGYWSWLGLLVLGHFLFVVSGKADPGNVWEWWWD